LSNETTDVSTYLISKKMKKIVLLTIILILGQRTFAQTGNGCANAAVITIGTLKVDTFFKGVNTFPDASASKWYKYTPTQDGLMTISSCGGGSDSRLFVYNGACSGLTLFAYNDDFCPLDASGDELAASVSKFVKSGQTYLIEWDNKWDAVRFNFSLSLATNYVAREIQTCATAKAIVPGTVKVDSLFGFATRGDASRANWYKYTPTKNGKISIGSCGVDVDTRLWIYKGVCGNLTKIAENDDDCLSSAIDTFAAAINDLAVVAGTTYYFEWDDVAENSPFIFDFFFDAATSVDDKILSSQIQIAPNPASDFIDFNFSLTENKNLNIQVLNNVGQVVFNQKYAQILRGSEKIDVTHLQSGLYIVQISDGVKQTYKKVVVNH
jgi:Secretion system C-terminal sorting domain